MTDLSNAHKWKEGDILKFNLAAPTEDAAVKYALRQIKSKNQNWNPIVQSSKVSRSGSKGFLGFGTRQTEYEIEVKLQLLGPKDHFRDFLEKMPILDSSKSYYKRDVAFQGNLDEIAEFVFKRGKSITQFCIPYDSDTRGDIKYKPRDPVMYIVTNVESRNDYEIVTIYHGLYIYRLSNETYGCSETSRQRSS